MNASTFVIFGGTKFLTSDGKPVVPINSMWICDYCWEFHWDFKNVPLNGIANGSVNDFVKLRLKEIDGIKDFYFEIQKISSKSFRLDICRVIPKPVENRDQGNVLEVMVALLGQRETPIRRFMDYLTDKVSAVYNIDHMANVDLCLWTVKCVLKQHELSVLDTEAHHQQEQLIKELRSVEETKFREQLQDMAYLLQRESLENIYSGRQSFQFAISKTGYIQRTLKFANEIATKIRAKLNGLPYEQQTPVGVYLCYIFQNELRCIDKSEVLELFINAHKFGLTYLIHECIEFITDHLDDEYIIDAMMCAELIHDSGFLTTLCKRFLERYTQIKETPRYKVLLEDNLQTARVIVDSVLRYLRL